MTRNWDIYWTFDTADYQIVFDVTEDDDLDLSWDEGGLTRGGLESGMFVAFIARVQVIHKPTECVLGFDTLHGCIYESALDFTRSHRNADPLERNSSIMRALKGEHSSIVHYFPSMVRTAIADARHHAKAYLGIQKIA